MKKIQKQIDKRMNSIINENSSDDSLVTYNKLKEIGQSLYRYDQLSKASLKDEAKTESLKANNLISNFNSSEDGEPLKGHISNTKYVWHASGDSCEACQDLDGTEYDSADDIPDKPHPNCNCYIEAVECEDNGNGDGGDEPCDCYETVSGWLDDCDELCGEYESASGDGDTTLEELQSIANQIETYASDKIEELQELKDEINQLKDDAIEELMGIIDQTTSPIQIFKSNYDDLINLRKELGYYLDQSAEYYHTKANCEAAQLGDVGAEIAEMLGYLREYTDFIKDFIFKGKSLLESLENNIHDLEVNEAGRKLGKEHPDEPAEVIVPKPKGLPPVFW